MVQKKTWKEFRDVKMLWFVNRMLHIMGWAIVYDYEEDGNTLKSVYPARVKFRGFDENTETEGFIGISDYLAKNAEELAKEAKE